MIYKIKGVILNNEDGKVICFQGRAGSVEGEAYCTRNCAAFALDQNVERLSGDLFPFIATLHCCNNRQILIKEITQ